MLISQRTLRFGPHTLLAADPGSEVVPYFLAGRKMYYVGMTTGDLQPIGAEHLVGEMGGMWAHPLKVADGMTLLISEPDGTQPMAHAVELIELLSHIEWRYRIGGMEVKRRDFVAEDHAAFFALLTLKNAGARARVGKLHLLVWLKFLGGWFSGNSARGGDEFWLAADHERGHDGARHLFSQLAGTGEKLLTDKVNRYHQKVFQGVALEAPDRAVNRAFALAKANLQLLSADYAPNLPPYFLAGVPEYPQLFGCDTEYTVPGATAAGFEETAKSALLALADYGQRACGRIPHEITTNGRVFHPGNTQETPQFAAACWDYFRWTGDLTFLRRVYPLCKEGIDDYMPAIWGPAGSLYPIGDGVVERHGMGARKLDSTCYLFQALRALRDMAETLEYPDDARRYGARLSELGRRFELDWWLEDEQMYADSLHTDGTPQFDGHWTVVLPLQLGMAEPARLRRSLERIEREWVNRWGLVHTREREELVWTLPTGLLALTAFRYDKPDLGLQLLQNIAETASYGTLGAFKELIPIGLCFVQLWSAGLYAQGIIEGLLGLSPLAHLHRLSIAPCLPIGWPRARLSAVSVGAHTLTVEIWPDGLDIQHISGPEPLDLRYRLPAGVATLEHALPYVTPPELIADDQGRWLRLMLAPGQQINARTTAEHVLVQAPDRREEPIVEGVTR